MITNKHNSIDSFITDFPPNIQERLEEIRECIRQEAPNATECISYGIPTFKLHGSLVHFSAYKGHIGFYPGASGVLAFAEELKDYKTSKGTVQFPIDQRPPIELIRKIIQFRVGENISKFQLKNKK